MNGAAGSKTMHLSRRRLLECALALPAVGATGLVGCTGDDPGDGWDRGPIAHLIPCASHRAFVIKVSFRHALEDDPVLHVDDRRVPGVRSDSAGRFYAFTLGGLRDQTTYTLRLHDAQGAPLCDAWPLTTLPAPDARPEHVRVGAFTCAGGPQVPTPPSLFHAFKPAAYRRRLFDEVLSTNPDLVIANGDHVYFDLSTMAPLADHWAAPLVAPFVESVNAVFDPEQPVLGTSNEAALTIIGDDQIAASYGVRFRSTPVFFVTDDHDYFENDDATPDVVTFPPDAFHRALRDTLQRLYFPEFPADDDHPALSDRVENAESPLTTHFGRVRYGDLLGVLLYDCGGFLSLGDDARLVPPAVEAWLDAETRRRDTLHLVHAPSHPMGWTAGKWREWYPDALESTGSLVAAVGRDAQGGKYLWQPGWFTQHQRLLAGLASRPGGLVVSGDLHALGAVRIARSADLDLGDRPVVSVLSGPVGVGDMGWPSRARGVESTTPNALETEELLALDERNGVTILEFNRGGVRVVTLGCPTGWIEPLSLTFDAALDLYLPLA